LDNLKKGGPLIVTHKVEHILYKYFLAKLMVVKGVLSCGARVH